MDELPESAGPSQKSTVTKEKVQKDTDRKMASVREQGEVVLTDKGCGISEQKKVM